MTAGLKGYKAILETLLGIYYPNIPLSSLETYQNLDPLTADELQSRMNALVSDGFSPAEAWRLAWKTFFSIVSLNKLKSI